MQSSNTTDDAAMQAPEATNSTATVPHKTAAAVSAMDSPEAIAAFAAHIQDLVATQLHTSYRWMPTANVQKIAQSLAAGYTEGIPQQQTAIKASQSRMNFYDLPAEMRNNIYELALRDHSDDGAGTIFIRSDSDSHKPGLFTGTPALLHTSRQIRQEARGMYLSTSKFVIQVIDKEDVSIARKWLRNLKPEARAQIKHLVLESDENFIYAQNMAFEVADKIQSALSANDWDITETQKETLKRAALLPTSWQLLGAVRGKCVDLVSGIIEYLALEGLSLEGFPKSAIVLKHSAWDQELLVFCPKTISSTMMFCQRCRTTDELESEAFSEGWCNGCTRLV